MLAALRPRCSLRSRTGCCSSCPLRSPREIDDDVSPALLHLGEGQRRHVAPDFQSLLDGPSHLGFYKLPREPDNSERQQTPGEESISHCPVGAAVTKTLSVGSAAFGLPLPPLCHTRASPIHRGAALAPSSKQQTPPGSKPSGCGPRGELPAELCRAVFSERRAAAFSRSVLCVHPHRGAWQWWDGMAAPQPLHFLPLETWACSEQLLPLLPPYNITVSGLSKGEPSLPSINSAGVHSSQLCSFL